VARSFALVFLNLSLWMAAALAFKVAEGDQESAFKCGKGLV
jgi:hypothetical protein